MTTRLFLFLVSVGVFSLLMPFPLNVVFLLGVFYWLESE
jgi:hypothetical protein